MNENRIIDGLVIVNDMHIQKTVPGFRTDTQYEEHVLEVFNQYADWALSKKVGLLFTGNSIRNISVKQALMLAELNKHIPLYVVSWQLNQVNSALVEMNCVTVLEAGEYAMGSKLVFIGPNQSETHYNKQILIGESSQILYYPRQKSESYASMPLRSALQTRDAVVGMAYGIGSALKPVILESDYDDSEWVKQEINNVYTACDFGFMDQIKALNIKAKEKASSLRLDDVSAIQVAINGMMPSVSKTFVQELFDAVSDKTSIHLEEG